MKNPVGKVDQKVMTLKEIKSEQEMLIKRYGGIKERVIRQEMLIKICQMKISVGKVVQKGGGYKNDMIMPIFYMFWNYREKEIMGRGT